VLQEFNQRKIKSQITIMQRKWLQIKFSVTLTAVINDAAEAGQIMRRASKKAARMLLQKYSQQHHSR
jgi:hypothetical protein